MCILVLIATSIVLKTHTECPTFFAIIISKFISSYNLLIFKGFWFMNIQSFSLDAGNIGSKYFVGCLIPDTKQQIIEKA